MAKVSAPFILGSGKHDLDESVFGEEFHLTVDDRSLTEVLRQHAKAQKLTMKIDEPVLRIDGTVGIIGPTRMRYSKAISAVDIAAIAVARVLRDVN